MMHANPTVFIGLKTSPTPQCSVECLHARRHHISSLENSWATMVVLTSRRFHAFHDTYTRVFCRLSFATIKTSAGFLESGHVFIDDVKVETFSC